MPRQRPLFLVRDPETDDGRRSPAPGSADGTRVAGASPETGVPPSAPDYRHYSDEQLLEERERRLRSVAEPTVRIELTSESHRAPVVDEQVDRITDELIRRARLRHPSARGRAG
jgi:hypothetical protein